MIQSDPIHVEILLEEKTNQYKCQQCDETFSSEKNHSLHVTIHSHDFVCPVCKTTFIRLRNFRRHINNHMEGDQFQCQICKEIFVSMTYLNKHISSHQQESSDSNICLKCNLHFSTSREFLSHKNLHRDIQQLTKTNWKRKLVASSSKSHFKCKACGKLFQYKASLNRHMLIHFDMRPFKCKTCSKAFNQSNALRTHMLLHSGIQPYSCKFCSKKFYQRGSMRSHLRNRHAPRAAIKDNVNIICILCNQNFHNLGSLQLHCDIAHKSMKTLESNSQINHINEFNPMLVFSEDNNILDMNGPIPDPSLILGNNMEHPNELMTLNNVQSEAHPTTSLSIIDDEYIQPIVASQNNHEDDVGDQTIFFDVIINGGYRHSKDRAVHFEVNNSQGDAKKVNLNSRINIKNDINMRGLIEGNSSTTFVDVFNINSGNLHGQLTENVTNAIGNQMPTIVSCRSGSLFGGKVCNFSTDIQVMAVIKTDNLEYYAVKINGVKKLQCPQCFHVFKQHCEIKAHLLTHNDVKLFNCHECGKDFKTKKILMIHGLTHLEKKYVCSVCSTKFAQQNVLACHMRRHTGAKPYKCDQCDKAFRTSGQRSSHRKSHFRIKTIKGETTPKVDASKMNLTLLDPIFRNADGEFPFIDSKEIRNKNISSKNVCGECGLTFSKVANLNAHMKRHLSDSNKEYKCSDCDKRFATKSNLRQHASTHSKKKKVPTATLR